MLKATLILPLLLSFTNVIADPIKHNHGERSHSHNLPSEKVAHSHGKLPTGSLSKNSSKNKAKAKEKPKMTSGDIAYMNGYVNQSIQSHAEFYFHRNTTFINSKFIRKTNWKENLKIECLKLANRMKAEFKNGNPYNYTLTNCLALTINQIKSRS